MTNPASDGRPEQELSYHRYAGNVIPWYVRLMWLVFWIFALAYWVRNLLPALQTELLTPP
ncbi:MAG: hypothetical protein KatS3mg114_1423 [Planctomycetaceae bacterium]|nr:MAG: hypothetical protein KatS3mg114_1423 [Planctomycetaceae bacterium]